MFLAEAGPIPDSLAVLRHNPTRFVGYLASETTVYGATDPIRRFWLHDRRLRRYRIVAMIDHVIKATVFSAIPFVAWIVLMLVPPRRIRPVGLLWVAAIWTVVFVLDTYFNGDGNPLFRAATTATISTVLVFLGIASMAEAPGSDFDLKPRVIGTISLFVWIVTFSISFS